MPAPQQKRFSGPVTFFLERPLPQQATPAGYSALIDAFALPVPLPRTLFAIGAHHRIVERDGWRLLTPRHAPHATLEGHLTFALKNEGIDLAVLKRLFLTIEAGDIEALVRATPTGAYARRIWFLYEWLTGTRLDLPDADAGRYVPVVDPELQLAAAGESSSRHRVKNNLPGTPDFCPLVFRTAELDRFMAMDLAGRARRVVAQVPPDVRARTAAFLLVKDSRSSYAIEGERPPQDRLQRWAQAIGRAGQGPLDLQGLLRLQQIVIGDTRFLTLGLRQDGGFVGDRDREGMPLPAHISARPDDLPALMEGMLAFARGPAQSLDPVVAAAVLAFGFVYVHPFEDGNGRIHRYLIHDILARRGFNPPGLIFPVSADIQKRSDDYRALLESYSKRLLPVITWEPTELLNLHVVNDTGDFYRFFDATPHAEFLYSCVLNTIETDLPLEADFLRRYDLFREHLARFIEMPDATADLLFRFLHQNGGRLSQRARQREFAKLTEAEISTIERTYGDAFGSASSVSMPTDD